MLLDRFAHDLGRPIAARIDFKVRVKSGLQRVPDQQMAAEGMNRSNLEVVNVLKQFGGPARRKLVEFSGGQPLYGAPG
jgi:hypothetical protein